MIVVALATGSLSAVAQDPCAADAVRLCSRARGDVAVLGCLRGQEKEVTPACRAELSALREIAEELGPDCEPDAQRLCAGTPRGEGKVLQCLRDKESFVSQTCQQAINRVRLTRSKIQASCAGDVGTYCRDVPDGGGRIVACLWRHEKELASGCREVVAKLR